mmetsp:Transcript_23459/g.28676  ORF Transcript_23459/g.28676 Transcript_23459/m.28676 type:complete len:97 (-) Transcript_23459:756-1046(-)
MTPPQSNSKSSVNTKLLKNYTNREKDSNTKMTFYGGKYHRNDCNPDEIIKAQEAEIKKLKCKNKEYFNKSQQGWSACYSMQQKYKAAKTGINDLNT